jgi:TolB-like protein
VKRILAELQRRNVTRMAILYVIAAWLVLQVADVGISVLDLPAWSGRLVFLLLALGFPIALVFAWLFELTPEGVKRESRVAPGESVTARTGQKMNALIVVLLVVAIGAIAYDRLSPRVHETPQEARSAEAEPAAGMAPPVAIGAPSLPAPESSIAVLPFVDLSPAGDNEYFADGLTEELLNSLVRIRALKVTGRTSAFAYKGRDVDLREVGEQLGVAHVLEGSVRKSGDRLRITAQLISAADGYHLWSETYDRELTDIFAIQSDIAGHVVEALQVTLLGDDAVRMTAGGTSDFEAYNDYLLGIYMVNQGSREEAVLEAVAALERAVVRDPAFVDAWVALGGTMTVVIANAWGSIDASWATIERAAREARRHAPELAGGYMLEALLLGYRDFDWSSAIERMRRAATLEPGNAFLMFNYGVMASPLALHDEAIAASLRAVRLEPANLLNQVYLGRNYLHAGRCEEAESVLRPILTRDPDYPRPRYYIGVCRYLDGEYAAALELFESERLSWMRHAGRPIALHKLGRLDEAVEARDELVARYADTAALQRAEVAAQWGDLDLAFSNLEHAFAVRDVGVSLLLVAPLLEPLRRDPRYEEALERVGLLPFAVGLE